MRQKLLTTTNLTQRYTRLTKKAKNFLLNVSKKNPITNLEQCTEIEK